VDFVNHDNRRVWYRAFRVVCQQRGIDFIGSYENRSRVIVFREGMSARPEISELVDTYLSAFYTRLRVTK
jgi:hypothetical protein